MEPGTDAGVVAEATSPVLTWIAEIDGFNGLDAYATRVAGMAQLLVNAGLDAGAASDALANVNDALTVRLLRLAESRLSEPPCTYAWLTLGSAGRREEALHSDQDNAIAFEDGAQRAYFGKLAELVVGGLTSAGLRPCPGGYIATRWQYPLADWQRIFRDWVERPEPQALIEAEVLLDFRRVHGDLSPAPLDRILLLGAGRPRFAVQMARAAVTFAPPFASFGQVRLRWGSLDLKRVGVAAVVLLARLYALAAGSTVRPTADRLAAAAAGGMLSRDGAHRLTQAHRTFTDLRLRTQLRQFAEGQPIDSRVRLDGLTVEQREALLRALRSVQGLQRYTARKYHTETVI
jgi:CBS domain-containing protein